MKHSLIINDYKINFYIGSCPTCKSLKTAKNTRGSKKCIDCVNKEINSKGYKKTAKIHPVMIGMNSKYLIRQLTFKKNQKLNLMSKGKKSKSSWTRIPPETEKAP